MANKTKRKKKKSQFSVALVYIATLIITFGILGSAAYYLVDSYVFNKPDTNIEDDGDTDGSYVPTSDDDFTLLISNGEGDKLGSVFFLKVSPIEKRIKIVPLSPYSLGKQNGKDKLFFDTYKVGKIKDLKNSVEETLGVKVDRYIDISNSGFTDFVNIIGGISWSIPYDMEYTNPDTGEITKFEEGTEGRTFWGDDLRKLITYPLYPSGYSYNLKLSGNILTELLNKALSKGTEITNSLTSIFNSIYNNSTTDITAAMFNDKKEALSYLILAASNTPCDNLIPTGNWQGEKKFVFDSDFKSSLKAYLDGE